MVYSPSPPSTSFSTPNQTGAIATTNANQAVVQFSHVLLYFFYFSPPIHQKVASWLAHLIFFLSKSKVSIFNFHSTQNLNPTHSVQHTHKTQSFFRLLFTQANQCNAIAIYPNISLLHLLFFLLWTFLDFFCKANITPEKILIDTWLGYPIWNINAGKNHINHIIIIIITIVISPKIK